MMSFDRDVLAVHRLIGFAVRSKHRAFQRDTCEQAPCRRKAVNSGTVKQLARSDRFVSLSSPLTEFVRLGMSWRPHRNY
jgi:hypothetical protein